MKTLTTKKLIGLRNDVALERFGPDDLSEATNVEIDETGKVARRSGFALAVAGAWHSVYSCGEYGYAVVDGVLSYLDGVAPPIPLKAIAGTRVSYALHNGVTYWSDGIEVGECRGASTRPWGMAVPARPTLTRGRGTLREGRYGVTMTYVRDTGEESGAPAMVFIDVPDDSSIAVRIIANTDPSVEYVHVYATMQNGEVPMLVSKVSNTSTTLTYSALPSYGSAVRTQFMGPPPVAGHMVREFGGRLYLASEGYLWYSLPYESGLFDLRSGFVGMDSTVRSFAPVSDGVYVGSDTQIAWFAGFDPSEWVFKQVADYGTVEGTEVVVPANFVGVEGMGEKVSGWMSKRGFCFGGTSGQFKNATGGRYLPPAARTGASLFKIRGNTPQVVTTLFD